MIFFERLVDRIRYKQPINKLPEVGCGTDLQVEMIYTVNKVLRVENYGLKATLAERDQQIHELKIAYQSMINELQQLIVKSILEPDLSQQHDAVIALTTTPSNLNLAVQIAQEQLDEPTELKELLAQFVYDVQQMPTRMNSWFSYYINIWSKEFPVSLSFRYTKNNQIEQLDFLVIGNSGAECRVLNCSRVSSDENTTFTVTPHSRHQHTEVTAFCLDLAKKCANSPASNISILQQFDEITTTTVMGYQTKNPGILATEQPANDVNRQLDALHLIHEFAKTL